MYSRGEYLVLFQPKIKRRCYFANERDNEVNDIVFLHFELHFITNLISSNASKLGMH